MRDPASPVSPLQIEGLSKLVEDAVEDADYWRRRAENAEAECARLREALTQLAEACYIEFCSDETEVDCADDELVAMPFSAGESAITFGMIRRARKLLNPKE